jgi:hypothetical protein
MPLRKAASSARVKEIAARGIAQPDSPAETNVSLPLFYAIGARDAQMREFLEHWVGLHKLDGTMQEYYDHWILEKNANSKKPRWCIARDVLGWLD